MPRGERTREGKLGQKGVIRKRVLSPGFFLLGSILALTLLFAKPVAVILRFPLALAGVIPIV